MPIPRPRAGGYEHKAAAVALAPGAAWWPPRASPGAMHEERASDSGLWDSLQEGTGDRFHTDWPDFIRASLCSSWFPFLSLLPCSQGLCCASHGAGAGGLRMPNSGRAGLHGHTGAPGTRCSCKARRHISAPGCCNASCLARASSGLIYVYTTPGSPR